MSGSEAARRAFLRKAGLGTMAALVAPALSARGARAEGQSSPSPAAPKPIVVPPSPTTITGEEALAKLVEGNRRHVSGQFTITTRLAERRQEVARGQHPFAAIVGCSDSRLPPEIVFDHSLGDLFVVRVAGNIVDDHGLGSVEFAVTQFGTPLVLVLGHARCGAVAAALAGTVVPGHILSLIDAITPSVVMAKGQPGDALDNAIRANIRRTVQGLKDSRPILADLVASGKLKVAGAIYDLDTGKVELLP